MFVSRTSALLELSAFHTIYHPDVRKRAYIFTDSTQTALMWPLVSAACSCTSRRLSPHLASQKSWLASWHYGGRQTEYMCQCAFVFQHPSRAPSTPPNTGRRHRQKRVDVVRCEAITHCTGTLAQLYAIVNSKKYYNNTNNTINMLF